MKSNACGAAREGWISKSCLMNQIGIPMPIITLMYLHHREANAHAAHAVHRADDKVHNNQDEHDIIDRENLSSEC